MKIVDLLSTNEKTMHEGDNFDIELDDLLIETYIIGFTSDGVVVNLDDTALAYLQTDELNELNEAEYQGRNVPLGKRMAGDVKKSKVYVRKPNGNIVKVNFGDKKMRIKKSNPARRKSFRARHNCENPGPRWKARYWSCRAWE
jgi:hypothetical protein